MTTKVQTYDLGNGFQALHNTDEKLGLETLAFFGPTLKDPIILGTESVKTLRDIFKRTEPK